MFFKMGRKNRAQNKRKYLIMSIILTASQRFTPSREFELPSPPTCRIQKYQNETSDEILTVQKGFFSKTRHFFSRN